MLGSPIGDPLKREAGVGHGKRHAGVRILHPDAGQRHRLPLEKDLRLQQQVVWGRAALQLRLDRDLPGVDQRRDRELPDVKRGNRLQPHRLPDPRIPGVPTAKRLVGPHLLSPDLPLIVRVVIHADRQDVFLLLPEQVGNVQLKGAVAAAMGAGQPPVDPDGGVVVRSPDM